MKEIKNNASNLNVSNPNANNFNVSNPNENNFNENNLKKYAKAKPITIIQPDTIKETFLDNYYSKDFLKKYFL
jgi:hypothetical protein